MNIIPSLTLIILLLIAIGIEGVPDRPDLKDAIGPNPQRMLKSVGGQGSVNIQSSGSISKLYKDITEKTFLEARRRQRERFEL